MSDPPQFTLRQAQLNRLAQSERLVNPIQPGLKPGKPHIQTNLAMSQSGLAPGVTRVKKHISSGSEKTVKVPHPRRVPMYSYRAVRLQQGGYDPEIHGMTGYKGVGSPKYGDPGRKLNDFYGPNTVFSAKTLKGAHMFVDEYVRRWKAEYPSEAWGIYRIQNRDQVTKKPLRRGIDISSSHYPELAASRSLPDVLIKDKRLYKANLEHKKAYQKGVARLNEEIALEGPIPKEHIKLEKMMSLDMSMRDRRYGQTRGFKKLEKAFDDWVFSKERARFLARDHYQRENEKDRQIMQEQQKIFSKAQSEGADNESEI